MHWDAFTVNSNDIETTRCLEPPVTSGHSKTSKYSHEMAALVLSDANRNSGDCNAISELMIQHSCSKSTLETKRLLNLEIGFWSTPQMINKLLENGINNIFHEFCFMFPNFISFWKSTTLT